MSTPIIDYASPASRRSLRLPARSEIRWVDGPGFLKITQVLSGREGAIGALLLAGFTFVLMTLLVHGMLARWHRNIGEIVTLSLFMAAELVVGALVVHNTWRKTVLTVTRQEMTLQFSAPFGGGQRFVFPSEQIAAVSVVDRPPMPGEAVVAELEIRMWSIPPVQLFAGHPRMTLMTIAREIGAVQPMAPPPLPGVEANAMAQAIDVARPASVMRVTPPTAEER
jgi:hypothetical protein